MLQPFCPSRLAAEKIIHIRKSILPQRGLYALSWFDYFLFGREDALPFCCLSAALHNGPCGTDGEAITTMQAVLLLDENRL